MKCQYSFLSHATHCVQFSHALTNRQRYRRHIAAVTFDHACFYDNEKTNHGKESWLPV